MRKILKFTNDLTILRENSTAHYTSRSYFRFSILEEELQLKSHSDIPHILC